jgi:hypothetical protein
MKIRLIDGDVLVLTKEPTKRLRDMRYKSDFVFEISY